MEIALVFIDAVLVAGFADVDEMVGHHTDDVALTIAHHIVVEILASA